jgi:hypothetical protein
MYIINIKFTFAMKAAEKTAHNRGVEYLPFANDCCCCYCRNEERAKSFSQYLREHTEKCVCMYKFGT